MTDIGLRGRQRKFIAAMLTAPNIKAAAAAAGIGERTAHKYLDDPAVKNEIHRMQDAAVMLALASLAEMGQDAIGALRQSLALLGEHVGADLSDFMEVDGDGRWTIDVGKARERLHLVKKLYRDKDGRERLELHDPQAAAARLASVALDILAEQRQAAEFGAMVDRLEALERELADRAGRGDE